MPRGGSGGGDAASDTAEALAAFQLEARNAALAAEVALEAGTLEQHRAEGPLAALSFSGRRLLALPGFLFREALGLGLGASLRTLDLSRNQLKQLPPAIGTHPRPPVLPAAPFAPTPSRQPLHVQCGRGHGHGAARHGGVAIGCACVGAARVLRMLCALLPGPRSSIDAVLRVALASFAASSPRPLPFSLSFSLTHSLRFLCLFDTRALAARALPHAGSLAVLQELVLARNKLKRASRRHRPRARCVRTPPAHAAELRALIRRAARRARTRRRGVSRCCLMAWRPPATPAPDTCAPSHHPHPTPCGVPTPRAASQASRLRSGSSRHWSPSTSRPTSSRCARRPVLRRPAAERRPARRRVQRGGCGWLQPLLSVCRTCRQRAARGRHWQSAATVPAWRWRSAREAARPCCAVHDGALGDAPAAAV